VDEIIAEVTSKFKLQEVAKMVNYSPSGSTPLDEAITHQNEHLIKTLLPFGAISIYHRTYAKNSAKHIWFLNLQKDIAKHPSPSPAKKKVDESDCCAGSKGCETAADCSSSKASCGAESADCSNAKGGDCGKQQHVSQAEILLQAKLSQTEQTLRVTQMELATVKHAQETPPETPPDYESMTDDELESVVAKMELDKAAIAKVLTDRKKETCVICLSGPRNHVSIPCGHKVFCGACGPLFVSQNCPMCRVQVQSVIKVFG